MRRLRRFMQNAWRSWSVGLFWIIICLGLWLGSQLIRWEYRVVIVDYLFEFTLEVDQPFNNDYAINWDLIGEQMRM